jgi:Spy/CpxP family protein refolding chaperone
MTMRGIWIKNSVLLLGMTLAGAALSAQQATAPVPEAATQNTASTAQNTTPATAGPRLTLEQKKQLRDLRTSARDQAAIVGNDPALNAAQKQAKLKELRAQTHEQMKSVLTPEQQKAFADRRAAGKARVAAALGLTPEQQSKMKDLFSSTHQQRQAVLTDAALTNEQKQAQLSQIRQTSQAQLATILTPEQLVKFQQMRKSHRHAKQG